MTSAFCNIPGIQSCRSLEFLANLLDPLCVYNKQGQVIYASASFLSLIQCPPEQIHFFNYFGAVTPFSTLHWFWQRVLQGESIEFFPRIQGSQEMLRCSLYLNPGTELIFLLARKSRSCASAPAVLQAYEKMRSMLADHPNLATVLVRSDGLIIQSNARFQELMAIDPAEPIYLEDLSHPEDQSLKQELRQKLIDRDLETYTIETRFVSRDNETVWFNCSASMLDLPEAIEEEVDYFMMILEDITENKRIYNALVRAEGKWKAFVLNSLNLFIQTSSHGQIIYVSPAVKRILGYEAEELLDLNIAELIHLDDRHEFNLALYLWQNSTTASQHRIECRWLTQAKGWVYLYMQGQRFPLGLEIDGIAISAYDITERKRLQAALRMG